MLFNTIPALVIEISLACYHCFKPGNQNNNPFTQSHLKRATFHDRWWSSGLSVRRQKGPNPGIADNFGYMTIRCRSDRYHS